MNRLLTIVAIMSFCLIFDGCNRVSIRSQKKEDSCEVGGCPGIGPEEGVGPASFAGPANYASIDQSNVRSLVGGAFFSGQFSRTTANRSATQDLKDIDADNLRTLRLPLVLSESTRLIDLSSPSGGSRQAYNEVGMENGSCGGSFEFLLDKNDAMRELSGSFTYSKYCDQGITVTGKASVQGIYNASGEIQTIDFIFSNLSDDRVRMEGEITVEFADTQIECDLDFYAEDLGTGKVCWINQCRLYIYEFSDYVEFEFYGNYDDPDFGYVPVTTTENFHIYGDDKWPSSGSLLIEGKDNVTAELITVDTTNCVIKADLDGDGVLDYESEILNWESLI